MAEAPSRWLGRRSTVGQDLAGGADGLAYLRGLVRGNRVRRQAAFDAPPSGSPPVLLIHGFLGTRGSMYMLERRMVEDGFVVVSFNIGTLNVRDIRRSAFMIHRKIERVLAQTPWEKIEGRPRPPFFVRSDRRHCREARRTPSSPTGKTLMARLFSVAKRDRRNKRTDSEKQKGYGRRNCPTKLKYFVKSNNLSE